MSKTVVIADDTAYVRDRFAAAAMQALILNDAEPATLTEAQVAHQAFGFADAMVEYAPR